MQVRILFEYDYVDEFFNDGLKIKTILEEWIAEQDKEYILICEHQPSDEDAALEAEQNWLLGVEYSAKRAQQLKTSLNFFNKQCQTFELNCSVSNDAPVSYFGFEEGKPDMFEVANYLGL